MFTLHYVETEICCKTGFFFIPNDLSSDYTLEVGQWELHLFKTQFLLNFNTIKRTLICVNSQT